MVHTRPPWTSKWRMATIFEQIDSGELAARLGSPNTFDRRGDTVFMDDFEAATLKWKTDGAGDNAAVSLSAAWAKTGSQSCKLTAGEGAGGQAWIFKRLEAQVVGKIGAECSFTVNADTGAITFELRYYNGTHYYVAYIKYFKADKKFQYVNSGGGFVDLLTDIELESDIDTFNTVKIVSDTDSLEYVRFICNDTGKSMANLGLRRIGDDTPATLYFSVNHASAHAAVKSIYIDDIILTQNEP